ncbi:MAG: conjugal transfer protein TraX [Butyrivibrio sp.]|nr:conjugal transfer protein TraX [Acetatifactor muris]MCM1559094.1 conjugal transfer protein TraX [Butyrivibrio sp.]
MDNMQAKAAGCEPPVQKGKGIPGSTVKIIAVAAMLIDHVAAALLTRLILVRGYYGAVWDVQSYQTWMQKNWLLFYGMQLMRTIGRLGFPVFCFLLVEGFQKTRNVKKYAFRLGLFALISEVPFDLALAGRVWYSGYQNVYFTLLIGILTLWIFDIIKKHRPAKWLQTLLMLGGMLLIPFYAAMLLRNFFRNLFGIAVSEWLLLGGMYLLLLGVTCVVWQVCLRKRGFDGTWRLFGDLGVLAVTMALADLLRTDYGGMGVLTIAVMYALRSNRLRSMAGGCGALVLMSLIKLNASEIPAFLALLPIIRYNGERGLKMKYFFYIFYPAHLLIIWLICHAMGIGRIPVI